MSSLFSPTIGLSRGLYAIVDADDYERLSQHKWHATADGYAARNDGKYPNRKTVLMHRCIANFSGFVDHINGDKLDNRKSNLRECSQSQNGRNSIKRQQSAHSKHKGVTKDRGSFSSRITVNRKTIKLGYYKTEEEAAMAYNKAAIKYHGEFARLNILT